MTLVFVWQQRKGGGSEMQGLHYIKRHINWVAVALAVLGLILNAQKILYCWPIFILSNVIFFIYFLQKKEYSLIFLTFVYFCVNIYGWYAWSLHV